MSTEIKSTLEEEMTAATCADLAEAAQVASVAFAAEYRGQETFSAISPTGVVLFNFAGQDSPTVSDALAALAAGHTLPSGKVYR